MVLEGFIFLRHWLLLRCLLCLFAGQQRAYERELMLVQVEFLARRHGIWYVPAAGTVRSMGLRRPNLTK